MKSQEQLRYSADIYMHGSAEQERMLQIFKDIQEEAKVLIKLLNGVSKVLEVELMSEGYTIDEDSKK